MTKELLPNGANPSNQAANVPLQPPAPEGRDRKTGRFLKGNKSGTGNPYAHRIAQLRAALFQSVTPDDVKTIAVRLVNCAKTGDLTAIKMVFDYCIGRPSKDDQCDPAEDTEEDTDEVPEGTGTGQHGPVAHPQSTKMVAPPSLSAPVGVPGGVSPLSHAQADLGVPQDTPASAAGGAKPPIHVRGLRCGPSAPKTLTLQERYEALGASFRRSRRGARSSGTDAAHPPKRKHPRPLTLAMLKRAQPLHTESQAHPGTNHGAGLAPNPLNQEHSNENDSERGPELPA